MLSDFKKFVKNNESDIFLTISIILVSLIIFGIIILINLSKDGESIIIQNPTPSTGQAASIIENVIKSEELVKQGMFVGSINSNKYHWPDCSFAKRIADDNKVWFSSEQEAQDAGYIRCGSFEKYGP